MLTPYQQNSLTAKLYNMLLQFEIETRNAFITIFASDDLNTHRYYKQQDIINRNITSIKKQLDKLEK